MVRHQIVRRTVGAPFEMFEISWEAPLCALKGTPRWAAPAYHALSAGHQRLERSKSSTNAAGKLSRSPPANRWSNVCFRLHINFGVGLSSNPVPSIDNDAPSPDQAVPLCMIHFVPVAAPDPVGGQR